MRFATHALRAGLWVGPTAHAAAWQVVMVKLWQRVRLLRSALPIELPLRVAVSNAACQGRPCVFRQHREALQILAAGPRHALNHCMITQMRHLGASLGSVDLGIMGKATKFRVVSKCRGLDSALYVFEELTAGLLDDDFISGLVLSGGGTP
eukprot:7780893-Pyramimonas_sp.AAC.1